MSGNLATAGMRITAAWLNLNIPGPWQAITLQNSWVNHGGTSPSFQCRQFNSVTGQVMGRIDNGAVTAGATLGNLPSGLLPISTLPANGIIMNGTGAGGAVDLVIQASGAIQLLVAATGATGLGLNFYYPLDV